MRYLIVLFCCGLIGCGGITPKHLPQWQSAPIPLGHDIRQNVVNLAWHEWRIFGGQTIEHRLEGPVLIKEGYNQENDEPARSRIEQYWLAVTDMTIPSNLTHQPWSAAFISWVFKQAGVHSDEFPFLSAHARYLIWLRDNKSKDSRIKVHSFHDIQGAEGDLLCALRGFTDPTMQIENLHEKVTMHCDIVVAVSATQISTIGGNLQNSVTLNQIPLDTTGFPIRSKPWIAWVRMNY